MQTPIPTARGYSRRHAHLAYTVARNAHAEYGARGCLRLCRATLEHRDVIHVDRERLLEALS